MGCTTSLPTHTVAIKANDTATAGQKHITLSIEDDSPQLDLTESQRNIIVATWKQIGKPENIDRMGVDIFTILLSYPNIKNLFPFRDLSAEAMVYNKSFKSHAFRFARVVSTVVDELSLSSGMNSSLDSGIQSVNVNEDGETKARQGSSSVWHVGLLLKSLGENHTKNNELTPEIFKEISEERFPNAMLQIWECELGSEQWSLQIEEAWRSLFVQIIKQVYLGYFIAYNKKTISKKRKILANNRYSGKL